MVEKYPWNCLRGGWTSSSWIHLGFNASRWTPPIASARIGLNGMEDRARKGKGFPMEKQCKMFRVEALLGLQAYAAVAGTAALAGCSPSKEKNDVTSGERDQNHAICHEHERAGLPSFFVSPDPITDIKKKTLDFDVVVVGAGAAAFLLPWPPARPAPALRSSRSCRNFPGNTGKRYYHRQKQSCSRCRPWSAASERISVPSRPRAINVWIEWRRSRKWVLDHVKEAGGSVVDQGNNQQSKASNEVNGYSSLNYVTSYMDWKPFA